MGRRRRRVPTCRPGGHQHGGCLTAAPPTRGAGERRRRRPPGHTQVHGAALLLRLPGPPRRRGNLWAVAGEERGLGWGGLCLSGEGGGAEAARARRGGDSGSAGPQCPDGTRHGPGRLEAGRVRPRPLRSRSSTGRCRPVPRELRAAAPAGPTGAESGGSAGPTEARSPAPSSRERLNAPAPKCSGCPCLAPALRGCSPAQPSRPGGFASSPPSGRVGRLAVASPRGPFSPHPCPAVSGVRSRGRRGALPAGSTGRAPRPAPGVSHSGGSDPCPWQHRPALHTWRGGKERFMLDA